MSDPPIRIVIADDHALVREGVRRVLAEEPDIEVVAEAEDGPATVAAIERHSPDVVVADIAMPGASGFAVARTVARRFPEVRVLILSMHNNLEYVERAVREGCRGFLLKDEAGPSELRDAVRTVHAGGMVFSPGTSGHIASAVGGTNAGGPDVHALTPREREVLRFVARGLTSKAIAVELGISPRTVETHREKVMRKLDVHSVAGLTRLALETGILSELPAELDEVD